MAPFGNPEKAPAQSIFLQFCAILAILVSISFFMLSCGGGSSPPAVTPGVSPSITSILPDRVMAGSNGFTLIVNGSNFNDSSTVRWNGSARTTEYVGSTRLQAAITAEDLSAAGSATISVRNNSPTFATSNGINFTVTNSTPTITFLYPSKVTAGTESFTLIIYGRNFIASPTVRIDGTQQSANYISETRLSIHVSDTAILNPKTIDIDVMNPHGASWSNSMPLEVESPNLHVSTNTLPDATPGKEYSYQLLAEGGIPSYSWSLESGGLPVDLHLNSTGAITGTLPGVMADDLYAFRVRVADSETFPSPNTATRDLSIQVRNGGQGRNDTCGAATATPISNGVLRASISPHGDIDVYSFEGTQGNMVRIELFAQRLDLDDDPASRDVYMDTFLEILDDTCTAIVDNDDIDLGVVYDSLISNYILPDTGTYYIRVSDLRGGGRPDYLYDITLSGAD